MTSILDNLLRLPSVAYFNPDIVAEFPELRNAAAVVTQLVNAVNDGTDMPDFRLSDREWLRAAMQGLEEREAAEEENLRYTEQPGQVVQVTEEELPSE